MRLATITNVAYGATLLLTTASAGTMLLASKAQESEREAVAQRYQLDKATSDIEKDAYALTGRARLYVVTGDETHAIAYRGEAASLGTLEGRLRRVTDLGALPSEVRALKEALGASESLHDEQRSAIDARGAGRSAAATKILFGSEYQHELDRVDAAITRFQDQLDRRTYDEVRSAEQLARAWRRVSEVVLSLTGLLFVFVLYFVFKRRVLRPVMKLSDVVTRLAAQDYAVEPPPLGQIDEIGDMAQAIRVFRENGLERQWLEEERAQDRATRDLLARLSNRLQGCDTIDELAQVVMQFVPDLLPTVPGRLYLLDRSRNVLIELCGWRAPLGSTDEFPSLSCWGLRRGGPHRLGGSHRDISCGHLGDAAITDALCLPLIVQREAVGLLYLEPHGDTAAFDAAAEVYLPMLTENLGLAIGNLQLRESLREIASADALTGLANRRHLDAVFDVEATKATREGHPLSCLMLDVDHFKQFNDRFGHDAGDAVLRSVGRLLRGSVREEGLAFRYGGEEFVLLLPGLDAAQAEDRAEQIRERAAKLSVVHEGVALGLITISVGIASAPLHCAPNKLLTAADAALFRAKETGRDRVVTATVRDADKSVA